MVHDLAKMDMAHKEVYKRHHNHHILMTLSLYSLSTSIMHGFELSFYVTDEGFPKPPIGSCTFVVLPSCFVISHFMNARDHFLCSYKQDSVFLSQLVMKAIYNVQPCGAMILLTMNAGGTSETEIDSSSHTSHVE